MWAAASARVSCGRFSGTVTAAPGPVLRYSRNRWSCHGWASRMSAYGATASMPAPRWVSRTVSMGRAVVSELGTQGRASL